MNKPGILIIDDEAQIRKLLEIALESNGYTVQQAENGKAGIRLAANHPPELILLDIGLPDESGHKILEQLRTWYNNPVIMLSVRNSEEDIVRALDHGATDYLTKPFRIGELLARIRSCLRRSNTENGSSTTTCGNLQIDFGARTVKRNDELVKLTSTEYKLLALFVRNEGRVLTHQYILREIWGTGFQTETQYLRVYVAQLRKKIEDNPNSPQHLITESGVGYRFA